MWVYQERQETKQAENFPVVQETPPESETPAIENIPEETAAAPAVLLDVPVSALEKPGTGRRLPDRDCILLAAAYLLGTFLAGVAAARCTTGDAEPLAYYLNCWQSLFSVQDAAGAVGLFRTELLTVASALTVMLFLGLSALGPLPIFFFTMLYGTGSGLLSAQLLTDLTPQKILALLCVSGLPTALAAAVVCIFGASALQVSGRLCANTFGCGGQAPAAGALLGQFVRSLFLLLPLCGGAVGMLYLAGQAKII